MGWVWRNKPYTTLLLAFRILCFVRTVSPGSRWQCVLPSVFASTMCATPAGRCRIWSAAAALSGRLFSSAHPSAWPLLSSYPKWAGFSPNWIWCWSMFALYHPVRGRVCKPIFWFFAISGSSENILQNMHMRGKSGAEFSADSKRVGRSTTSLKY